MIPQDEWITIGEMYLSFWHHRRRLGRAALTLAPNKGRRYKTIVIIVIIIIIITIIIIIITIIITIIIIVIIIIIMETCVYLRS